jgi:hypothetical protein
MQRFTLEITEELSQALWLAVGNGSRNALIEDWLWKVPAVKAAAKDKGIKRKPRLQRGRPSTKKASSPRKSS